MNWEMSKGVWYSARMPPQTPATRFLDAHKIPYRLFEHSHPPASLEEAAFQRGQAAGQVVRSILFRLQEGKFVMVLMAGPGQLSWKRIRNHLGISRLSLATRSEVMDVTGYEIGTVNPFGTLRQIRILADESVFVPELISIGTGVPGVAIIMNPKDLSRVLPTIEIGAYS